MRTRQSLRRPPRLTPIRHCSRWGLPCRFRCRNRGGLLPHRFTLAFNAEGGLFSAALSLGSPRPGVTRHRRLAESGLSSQNDACAAIRPSALIKFNSGARKNQTFAIRLKRYRENGCRFARSLTASTSAWLSSSPIAQGRNLSLNEASKSSNRMAHSDLSGTG